jgi:hypothetical protein
VAVVAGDEKEQQLQAVPVTLNGVWAISALVREIFAQKLFQRQAKRCDSLIFHATPPL